MGSPKSLRCFKTAVCIILICNIAVGAFVIFSIIRRGQRRQTNRAEDFKRILDDICEQQMTDLPVEDAQKGPTTRASLEFLSLLKPVVHLSGLDFHGNDHALNSTVIRNWVIAEGSRRHVLYNGPTYEDGSITVPVDGKYVVYSHLKFYVSGNKREDTNLLFEHKIVKTSHGHSGTVMANQITECKEGVSNGAHLEYPSNVRGVLELKKNDRLTVTASHQHLLRDDTDWHYFGMYLI